MNQGRIPTIIGVLILLVGLGFGVYLIQSQKIFKLGAEGEVLPKDVRISNITDSSFTVSWTTDKESSGFITWGEGENNTDRIEDDEIEGKSYTHFATIRGLNESSDYFFKINSGGNSFDNNGIPWQITTGKSLINSTASNTVSGSVLSQTGEPASKTLIYLTIGGAQLLSTSTSENGNWVINISSLRTNDLSDYYLLSPTKDVIEIIAHKGPKGSSSAQVYISSANPVPPMILGEAHNFKNSPANESGETPEVDIMLPEDATSESKFDTGENIPETSKNVSIESIDEGEVISTEKPQFFGDGPAGETITITVESEIITASLKVGSSGNWSWTPPKNLSAGVHKVTITWRDENGILRSIIRNFIVQASEVPAFEATPSATPSQTPTSTPTQSPTVTPTIKPTSTPTKSPSPTPLTSPAATLTPTPTVRATGTPLSSLTPAPTLPPTPESGNEIPSVVLFALGIILLTTGVSLGSYALLRKHI